MNSEEQYKYTEDKIKEAANAADHAFNEAAWKKMEALLDQQKDKRRPFFWIFPALILGALLLGTGIIYQAVNKNEQPKNTRKQIQPPLNGKADMATVQQTILPEKNENNTNTADDNYPVVNKNIYKDKAAYALKITVPGLENDQHKAEQSTSTAIDTYIADNKSIKTDIKETAITIPLAVNKTDTSLKINAPVTKTENKKENKKEKKKTTAGIYVLAAAGMDANATKLLTFKNSLITPVYGVGLGYQFNRRLSVQSGFYAGAKKYIAGPNDYIPKAGSYLSMVKIIKVDADCMVYEVPLTVQYNWLIKPKANYYASVGVSSYIMKKEKYNYTFESNNTQYSYPYDYTKNSRLAASVQLSLGMERQIGRKLSVQAAPVISLPLQGAGEGSVKIFTTGLHMGLKYFPFKN